MSRNLERSYTDLHEEFLGIEEELDLFDLSVDGVPVWERVRFPLGMEVQNSGRESASKSSRVGSVPLRSRLGDALTAISTKNPFLKRPSDLLVWGHNRRQLQDDGTYWELYCDPVYEAIDEEYLHLEIPHQGRHYTPARTDQLAYMDLVRFGGAIQRKLGRGTPDLPVHVDQRLRHAEDTFENRFGLSLDIRERVRQNIAVRRTTKPLYGALLDWHDPSVALVVVSYGKETFIEACQARSIPVLELQHGVITPYHYGYSYPGDRRKETFPDLLLTFGQYWNEAVSYPEGATTEAVGYPFLEQEYERHSSKSEDETVVFVSQHNHAGQALSRLAVELRDILAPSQDVVYKLHPEEYHTWRSKYPWLDGSSVDVVGQEGPSLYELFAGATAVVGVYSTALFEAVTFDVPVYVLRHPGHEYLSKLLDTEAATAVDEAAQLAKELQNPRNDAVATDRFFESEPLANIRSVLVRYLA